MLLDTNVLIELRRRPRSDPLIRRIREAVGQEPFAVSAIQFGEVADACRRHGSPVDVNLRAVAALAEAVPVSARIAAMASEIKAEARSRPSGRGFRLIDGVILATARVLGLKVLTFAREFARFDDAVVLSRR